MLPNFFFLFSFLSPDSKGAPTAGDTQMMGAAQGQLCGFLVARKKGGFAREQKYSWERKDPSLISASSFVDSVSTPFHFEIYIYICTLPHRDHYPDRDIFFVIGWHFRSVRPDIMTKYWVFSCGVQALTLTYREIRDVSAELLTVLHNGVDYGLTSISTIGPYTDSLEVIMVSPLEEPLGRPAIGSGLSIAILQNQVF